MLSGRGRGRGNARGGHNASRHHGYRIMPVPTQISVVVGLGDSKVTKAKLECARLVDNVCREFSMTPESLMSDDFFEKLSAYSMRGFLEAVHAISCRAHGKEVFTLPELRQYRVIRGALSYYKVSATEFFALASREKRRYQQSMYVMSKLAYDKVHRSLRMTSAPASGSRRGQLDWLSNRNYLRDLHAVERNYSELFAKLCFIRGTTDLSLDDDKLRRGSKAWLGMGATLNFTRGKKLFPVIHMVSSPVTQIVFSARLATQCMFFTFISLNLCLCLLLCTSYLLALVYHVVCNVLSLGRL